MKALVLHMADGASQASIIDDDIDLDLWVEQRYEGLQLLGVIRVELRGRTSKMVRQITGNGEEDS